MLCRVSADDRMVTAGWTKALSFLERAVEQGVADAQSLCAQIYTAGDRGVPQNWATAAKWWRKAAAAGEEDAQWKIGQCYYYGRGVDRDVAQAKVWFRKAAAQGYPNAIEALQTGVPGDLCVREVLARFTNAGSAPRRHEVAHLFARDIVTEQFLGSILHTCSQGLQEVDTVAPHQSVRDGLWVDCMLMYGLSDEDLELAKRIHAYSLRTCTFCGSNSAPLRHCSLCMEVHYCIATDCQYQAWNKTPAAESHKVLCPRIFVRGSKGRTRRPVAIESSSSSYSSSSST
jgi:hypothetical protein